MKEIKVMSLFDGMSGGQQAMKDLDLKIGQYYALEIEKASITITQKNHPETVQLGSVTEIDFSEYKEESIDIIIGGFPCRNLSRAVIERVGYDEGLKGKHSSLFYYLVEAIRTIQPKYFFVENVEGMKKEDKDIITETLGVEPFMVNSGDYSAQNRKRYYWTNIPQEEDLLNSSSELTISDIIQPSEDVLEKYWHKQDFEFLGNDKSPVALLNIKGHDILKRVYGTHQKCPTLTSCRGGNLQKKVLQDGKPRKLTPLEYERLQGFPDGYTEGVADTHRYNMLGDGWQIDVVKKMFSHLTKEYKILEKGDLNG